MLQLLFAEQQFLYLMCLLSLTLPLQALSYAGGFGKVLLPHVVEKEMVQEDGSVVKRLGYVQYCEDKLLVTAMV